MSEIKETLYLEYVTRNFVASFFLEATDRQNPINLRRCNAFDCKIKFFHNVR